MDSSKRIERLDTLARLLDSTLPIPGTEVRIGIDPILGLIPGIGDGIASILSGAILYEAAKLGAPKHVLIRMLGNVTLDALIGAIPVLGDIFDFAFRANQRNIQLLRSVPPSSYLPPRDSRAIGRLIAVLMLLIFGLIIFCAGYIAYALFELLPS